LPSALNSRNPVTSMPTAASSGETKPITAEGAARRSSLSISSLQMRVCGYGAFACLFAEFSAHPCSDLFDRSLRRLRRRRQPSLGDHRKPVADREQFIEFLGDHQDRDALVAQIDQRLAAQLGG